MGLFDEIQKTFDQHHDTKEVKVVKIGTAINITNNTCDVEIEGEAAILDVRLQAVEHSEDSHLLIKPKNKSLVAVARIDNMQGEAVIIATSEIESISAKCADIEVNIDSTGVEIKKQNESLKQALNLVVEAVQQIMVIQGNNPNYQKLTQANLIINKILK